MTSNNPNKGSLETTAPRAPGAGNTGALDDAAWHQKVDDDNAFLRNRVAAMTNAVELLLARTPQTTVEEPFNPFTRTIGAKIPNQPGAPFDVSSSQPS